jgi:hypothetical protein
VGDLEVLREKLGLPNAPGVNTGLATTASFFRLVVHEDPVKWWRYLRGIDFHKPVELRRLPRGTALIRYESAGERSLKPFSYFTDPGVSPFHLGTSFPVWQYKLFNVVTETPALVSKASSLSFDPQDRVSRIGGGIQYIVAFPDWPKLLRVGETKRAF